jgi:hypothetical protein
MRTLIAVTLLALAVQAPSANAPFLGKWNITGTGDNSAVVYWLEVKEEGGAVKGRFLNRWSSPYDLPNITIDEGELKFWNAPREGQMAPSQVWEAKVVDGRLEGTTINIPREVTGAPSIINWVGVRPPVWPPADANASHTFGDPVALFDGKTMDAWGVQHVDAPMNWSIVDGVMTSADKQGNNLVSKETFQDFKIDAEYAIAPGSNGGIYVRGRYELQVLDDAGDAGKDVTPQSHMAIYGRTPPSVNASKPAGEWQTMEAIVVGNRVTVILNGQKVHDNAVIEGITGGALDARETEPGPIMLQGDHGKVMFRRVIVTPITDPGR